MLYYKVQCKRFYVLLFRVTKYLLRLIIKGLIFKRNLLYKHTHKKCHVRQEDFKWFPTCNPFVFSPDTLSFSERSGSIL